MKSAGCVLHLCLLFLFLLSTFSFAPSSAHNAHQGFLQCLIHHSHDSNSITKVIYTTKNSTYTSTLLFSINNLRFAQPTTPKPQVIVTPLTTSHIQTVIYCSKKHGIQMRIRGGGHSFEGLSYVSQLPFVLLDMVKFSSISIDTSSATAWVEAGVTLGQLYYHIGTTTNKLGFPAGLWANVGACGLISGGGYGMMRRKYGLAADHAIDARLIDVNGRILDRKSMGEDLFWAIRGGGAGSFGVILSWKVNLVPVPKIVTMFRINRTLEQNLTSTFHKYQTIAPKFPKDLDMRCTGQTILSDASPRADKKTMVMLFESLYLGRVDNLLAILQKEFPELGVVREDCFEVSWLQAMVFFSNFQANTPPQLLLNRTILPRLNFKGRSDFTKVPMSVKGLEGLWQMMFKLPPLQATLQFTPYGGRMNEISESAIPFPYRNGTWFMMNMFTLTDVNQTERMEWIRSLATYLTPYVTKNPRSAYVNYVNLWMGTNNLHGKTSYEQASKWGKRYFKDNFYRLAQVKTVVDPGNFFRFEQSIPILS